MVRVNAQEALDLQVFQWEEKIPLSVVVPANSDTLAKVDIGALGMFRLTHITGRYTTLAKSSVAGQCVDTGVQYLRAKITDGATQRSIFSDYIPLELFISCGRRKAGSGTITTAGIPAVVTNPNVATDAPAPQLFFPIPLNYDFATKSSILVAFKNSSDCDQNVDFMFHGLRVAGN